MSLVVDYYLPIVLKDPPDELYGLFGDPTKDNIQAWLANKLSKAFPTPDELVNNINLEVNYKDVTFETLNRDDFLESIKLAYPGVDWDKTYREFRAAGEVTDPQSKRTEG
jgi:hypothetical protein